MLGRPRLDDVPNLVEAVAWHEVGRAEQVAGARADPDVARERFEGAMESRCRPGTRGPQPLHVLGSGRRGLVLGLVPEHAQPDLRAPGNTGEARLQRRPSRADG